MQTRSMKIETDIDNVGMETNDVEGGIPVQYQEFMDVLSLILTGDTPAAETHRPRARSAIRLQTIIQGDL